MEGSAAAVTTEALNATLSAQLTTQRAAAGNATCAAALINFTTAFLALVSTLRDPDAAKLPSAPPAAATPAFDFIVVGGGAAGCVLASRLSEIAHWRVLLIEAGGEEPFQAQVPAFMPYLLGEDSAAWNWNFTSQAGERACGGRGCPWPMGRALGGSSVLGGMLYVRGNPRDYDRWAALGNTGWGWEDVLKYFKMSEDNRDATIAGTAFHARGGPLPVQRFAYEDINVRGFVHAFREMGYGEVDVNSDNPEGVMRTQTTSKTGERMSVNRAFLRLARIQRRNLQVITNARVTRVVIDPATRRATGVEYVLDAERGNRTRRANATKEVLVSAGAVGSPHLLMLSGVGPRERLRPLGIPLVQDLSVGYNLQDHVSADGVRLQLSSTAQGPGGAPGRLADVARYVREGGGPLAATGVLQVSAFIRSQYERADDRWPDIQFGFDPEATPSLRAQELRRDGANASCANVSAEEPLAYYDRVVLRPTVLRPRSRGLVALNSSDPFDPPRIFPNYFSDGPDLDVLLEGLVFAARLAQTKILRDWGISLDTTPLPLCAGNPFGSFAYWTCVALQYTQSMFHPAGTCKMGPTFDLNAVVDPELKVYGVLRLRVIDASIMPFIVSGNTLAPTVMIAEKGADMVKRRWLWVEQGRAVNDTVVVPMQPGKLPPSTLPPRPTVPTTTARPGSANASTTSKPAPASPTTAGPASPATVKPASPTTAKPASPTTAKPASPTTAKPASPTTAKPASPTTAKPASPTTAKPASPTTAKAMPTTAAPTTAKPPASATPSGKPTRIETLPDFGLFGQILNNLRRTFNIFRESAGLSSLGSPPLPSEVNDLIARAIAEAGRNVTSVSRGKEIETRKKKDKEQGYVIKVGY